MHVDSETPPRRSLVTTSSLTLLSVFAVLVGGTSLEAQWTTQSPIPTHLGVRGIAAPANDRVFLATEDDSFDQGGALFESLDGGASWTQRGVPFSLGSGFNGIDFLDSQFGWAWGNENYRTTDGGSTWEALPFLGTAYFMEFPTPDFGLTTGNFGAYVSRDAGLTWNPSPNDMSAFSFADADTGLGVAASGVYRSVDGGANFNLVWAGAGKAVEFLTAADAVAIVDDELLHSADGGVTWTVTSGAQGRSRLFEVSPQVVLAWGRSGTHPDFDDRVLRSSDGGLTWADLGEVLDFGGLAATLRFVAPDADTVVVANGSGSLYQSVDAGATWALVFVSPGPMPSFFSSAEAVFSDALTGYYGMGSGFVIKTIDGGATWNQISSGSGNPLNAIDRFPSGDLIAVGDGGEILTNEGGTGLWILRGVLAFDDLEAVQVTGPQDVVAVDGSGILYRSADAGASWTTGSALPMTLEAADLDFSSPSSGWVVGRGFAGAALFHTADGGASWTPTLDFQGYYVAVDFEGDTGWAVSRNGVLQHSTDAGSTWTQQLLPGSSLAIEQVDFW
ncbi:MAG: hypothetical protein K8J08_05490, partial [Thermoanaerobaculia bacterium]|nr:hypothetical protein [Thermoanaerobaculia bacterium]